MKTAPGLVAALLAAVPVLAPSPPNDTANAAAPTAVYEIRLVRVSQMGNQKPTPDADVEDVGKIVLAAPIKPGDDPTPQIITNLEAAYGKLSISLSPEEYYYVYNPKTGQWEWQCRDHTQIDVPIPASDPVRVTVIRRVTIG